MKRIFCALLAGALTLGAALPVQAAITRFKSW